MKRIQGNNAGTRRLGRRAFLKRAFSMDGGRYGVLLPAYMQHLQAGHGL